MNSKLRQSMPLHIMLLLPVIAVFIYSYIPMAGIVISFEKFRPAAGFFKSPWVGWENFRYIFNMPNIARVLENTVLIAGLKIIFGFMVSLVFSLLLNEVAKSYMKRSIQTIVYLPHFLSWVITGGILIEMLSPSSGIINRVLSGIGIEPIFFLGNKNWFPVVLVVSDVWKEFGFNTVLFMAAMSGISQEQYEAAIVDGAGRWKQTLHVTLPGIMPISVLILILSMGNILNAGFDQVYNLYSPIVYETGDILDTLVFRMGITNAQYGIATAIGTLKSLVSFILIVFSYRLAYKFTGYRVF